MTQRKSSLLSTTHVSLSSSFLFVVRDKPSPIFLVSQCDNPQKTVERLTFSLTEITTLTTILLYKSSFLHIKTFMFPNSISYVKISYKCYSDKEFAVIQVHERSFETDK